MTLEYQILDLLEYKVRGSARTTLAKRLGISEAKLSVILDSMVDEKKLVMKGRYYRLPQVAKVIHAELPLAACHRILMKFSGLRISWDAVERIHFILENTAKSIATEAGNNAKSRKSQTVSMRDIDVATSRLSLPATVFNF